MELQEAVKIVNEYLAVPPFTVSTKDEVNLEEIRAIEEKNRKALKVLVYVAEKVIEGSQACL